MMTHGLASRMAFVSCGVEYEGRRLGIEPCNCNTITSYIHISFESTTITTIFLPISCHLRHIAISPVNIMDVIRYSVDLIKEK